MRLFFLMSLFSFSLIHAEEPPLKMIIFIHGTLGVRHQLSIKTFLKILRDNITQSTYEQSVKLIRDDPFFFQNQAIQHRGLIPISTSRHKNGPIAPLFAELFDQLTPNNNSKNFYYTFGWSGIISHKARIQDAQNFYTSIKDAVSDFENTHGVTPLIELVGYSHGGTLALLLEEIRQKMKEDPPFQIDQLTLLGTPVQKETERYICSPLFKKIFHFYSRGDHIQCLDCFSTKRFFSRRRFNNHAYCTLPDSLCQIEIKITELTHKKSSQTRRTNKSPGHMELWFFGWPTTTYRKHFPLYPLPTALFLPYIASLVTEKFPRKNHLVVELQPDKGVLYVRPRFKLTRRRFPFIDTDFLQSLQKKVLQNKPEHFNQTVYNAHINNAISHAYDVQALQTHKKRHTLCATYVELEQP